MILISMKKILPRVKNLIVMIINIFIFYNMVIDKKAINFEDKIDFNSEIILAKKMKLPDTWKSRLVNGEKFRTKRAFKY